jgi:hypothetical protein
LHQKLMEITLDLLLRHMCPWPSDVSSILEADNLGEAMFYLQEHLATMTGLELWKRDHPDKTTWEHSHMIEALINEANVNPGMAKILFPTYSKMSLDANPLMYRMSEERSTAKALSLEQALVEGFLITRSLFRVESTPMIGSIFHEYDYRDQLWFIEGLRFPAFLRPESGDGRYKFVGAAYIHGYMHGEILDTEWPKNQRSIRLV